jgi:hypothetical protein
VNLLVAVGVFAAMSFDLPRGWRSAPAKKTETAAAPVEDNVFELEAPATSHLRATLTLYSGKISDAELENAASERHQARLKNRVAWGMKAESGPPRESLKIGARRAVRWHDRVGGALGDNEQMMSCVVVASRLACVSSTGPRDDRAEAESLASTVLSSLRR